MSLMLANRSTDDPFQKAKVQLVLNKPFFGVLVMHLPTIPVNPAVLIAAGCPPTAAVDGEHIYYVKAWVESLTDKQRMGLLAHEVLHPALSHLWRRGARNKHVWRMATDFAVNAILLKDGFELPPGGLFDQAFDGMSAEQVYTILMERGEGEGQEGDGEGGTGKGKKKPKKPGQGEILDGQLETKLKPKKKPKPKPEPKPKDESGKDGEGKESGDDKDGKDGKDKDGKDKDGKDKDGQGKDGEEDGLRDEIDEPKGDPEDDSEEEDGEDGEEGSKLPDLGDPSKPGEDGEDGEDEEEGEGENEGPDCHLPGGAPGEPGDEPSDQQHEGEGDTEDHNCGSLDDKETSAEEEEKWKALLQQAAMVAKARGNLPGDLARLVEEVTEPKVPWQRIIEMFVNEVLHDDFDMMKQDRRFMQSGIYFPDLHSDGASIAVVVDTSGSIGETELKAFAGEIRGILLSRGVSKMRLMTCDDEVHLDVPLTPQDPMPDNFPGGGGTDFREPFKRIENDTTDRPALIIYITDMDGTFPDREIGIPTIWLAATPTWMKTEEFERNKVARAPFGQVIRYDPITEDAGAAFA